MTSPKTTCLGCGDEIPLGRSWCARCQPRKRPIPAYREHRRVRGQVLELERRCWLCGRPGTPDDPLTLDHVLARARGGQHTRANGRAAHRSCNSAKGAHSARKPGLRVIE